MSPRGGSRPSSPRGLFGRGSDTTSRKRTSRPGSSGGGTTPRGGPTPKNRWGGGSGGSGHHKGRGSRIGRGAARARDWADDRTGRKASAAWKAASGQRGFRARSKAASRAVRSKGAGRIISSAVGVIAAAIAGLASLFRRRPTTEKAEQRTEADQATTADDHDIPDWVNPTKTTTTTAAPTAAANTTGGTTMAGLPAANIAADMAAAMSRYEPEDAWAVLRDARQWPSVPRDVAMAMKAYVDRLETARFPLNAAVTDKIREMYVALSAVHAVAEEIEPLMRKAHAADLARAEARRGDESKWNVR